MLAPPPDRAEQPDPPPGRAEQPDPPPGRAEQPDPPPGRAEQPGGDEAHSGGGGSFVHCSSSS